MSVIEGTGKCYEDSDIILYIVLNAAALLYVYFFNATLFLLLSPFLISPFD